MNRLPVASPREAVRRDLAVKIVITECDHDSFAAEHEVTDPAGAELVLTQSRSAAELVAGAAGADAILVQYAPITAEIMDALPRLRAIGRYGVGVDSVDIGAATARGIAVCNVPDYGTESVSDHAIALALACARGIARLDRGLRVGSFDLAAVRPLYQTHARPQVWATRSSGMTSPPIPQQPRTTASRQSAWTSCSNAVRSSRCTLR
jgi:lactate dehydrogenase-like 2-hydroxyacid dehydrogenase